MRNLDVTKGTHQWIFEPWNVMNGDVNVMIAKAKEMGLTGVLIKFANGNLVGDPVSQRFMDAFKAVTPAFKQAGIRVGGWIYQYLTDVDGEIDACRQAVEAGAEWIVLDGEAEVYGKQAQVADFGQKLRAQFPNIPVALSSFAIAAYHDETKGQVPFNAYAAFVDVMMPQIYWATMGWDVAVAFNASIASYKKYGKPIAPTGQAYGGAKAADMARFVQLSKQAGITGISWWDMDEATADHLTAIKANILKPPAPVPSAPTTPPVQSHAGPARDVAADNWAAPAVQWALENGIMHVDAADNFNPSAALTRDQSAQLLFNFLHQTKGGN